MVNPIWTDQLLVIQSRACIKGKHSSFIPSKMPYAHSVRHFRIARSHSIRMVSNKTILAQNRRMAIQHSSYERHKWIQSKQRVFRHINKSSSGPRDRFYQSDYAMSAQNILSRTDTDMVTGVFIRATGISYEASNSNWAVESLVSSLGILCGAL